MASEKIMIVEDNATVARDLCDCLEDFGYNVTSIVASGEESVKKVDIDRPDAVMMDIHLRDEMNGIEAARQIYISNDIPIIFLSAYSDRDLLKKASQVGSFGYLIKPFQERELHATLEMALYKSKTEKERKRLEARLQQEQKIKSLQNMAGGIAHNFNNILQIALGNVELAKEVIPSGSQAQTFIMETETALNRAAEISKKMLTYVGHGQHKKTNTNFSNLLQRVIVKFKDTMKENISIAMNMDCKDIVVHADPFQIQKLIKYLLTNAMEAIDQETGTITINVRVATVNHESLKEIYLKDELPPGEYAVIEVADTGCGIEKEIQTKIYDPFFTTKFSGRGLGLAAAFGILKAHRGAIKFQSTVGEGTTFQILLPVVDK